MNAFKLFGNHGDFHAILLSLFALLAIGAATATQAIIVSNNEVAQANLSSISYGDLHELVVLDQIKGYRSPIKSLNTRRTKPIHGNYDFCLDPEMRGFKFGWQNSDLVRVCQEENFYKMPVPSAFNHIVSNATLANYMGWFWYQTKIDLSNLDVQRASRWHNFLQLESVNYLALVWLRQADQQLASFVGSHVGGHLPFVLNISNYLSKLNNSELVPLEWTLTIAVSNQLTRDTIPSGLVEDLAPLIGREYKIFKPDFDFFHFAGILGEVNLISLPETHITLVERLTHESDDLLAFRVCLNKPAKNSEEIQWLVYHNQRNLNDFELVKFAPDDSTFGKYSWFCQKIQLMIDQQSRNFELGPQKKFRDLPKIKFGIKMTNSALWDDIYETQFALNQPNQCAQQSNSIGRLEYPLQGFGMHQEQLFSGRTMSLAAIMKDIYLLKEVGANVIRTSHYPYSEAYLDACDAAGIMVIAECPAVGLSSFSRTKLKLHKQMLLEMMQRDSHHPSIIMWSVANEPQSQRKEARAYFEELLTYAREDLARFTVQARRPLTAAIAQSHDADTIGDLLDVVMVNRYYGWYDYSGVIEAIRPALHQSLLGWAQRLPGKPLVVSEFGADSVEGLHSSIGQLFSEEYQRDLIVEHEQCFDELLQMSKANTSKINLIGSMVWNFADFSTHNSLGRVGGNRKGLFTRSREPKLAAEEVKRIYRSRLATAWDCAGYELSV